MPYHYKLTMLLLVLISFSKVNATINPDTTKRKIQTIGNTSNFDQFGFIKELGQGMSAIRADSIDKGIQLIYSGLTKARVSLKIDRVNNFIELELYNITELIATNKLSPEEKMLGQQLFKTLFTQPGGPNNTNMLSYFKTAPNTLFVKRVKLLVQTNGDVDGKLETMLNDGLKQQPNLLPFVILKATVLFEKEKYAESIQYCDKALQVAPTYAFANNLKSKCYGSLGEPENKIIQANAAIKLFPTYVDAYYNKCSALYDLDKYREAVDNYKRITQLSPDYLYTNYYLGRCYKALKMADSAMYYANATIKQYPDDDDGYNLKGDIYYARDDYANAIDWFAQAIKLEPDDYENYEDRGDAYYYSDNVDSALADFTKAASIDKNRAYLPDRIGDCYYKNKDYEKSISYHQQAIRIDPKYKYAYVGLDLCYDKLGKHQLAIEACKKAIAIDSTYDSALGNLGWEYCCVGKYDNCIQFSYKALKYDETATYAMFNIALATLCKGDYVKAKELYAHFLNLCKEKKYDINDGAVTDLRDLIKKNFMADRASAIITEVFDETP
jgi:tetratricopeptide (TPR) repeat protein